MQSVPFKWWLAPIVLASSLRGESFALGDSKSELFAIESSNVQVAGCERVTAQEGCHLSAQRRLTFWVPHSDGAVGVTTDVGPVHLEQHTSQLEGGTQQVVRVPANAHRVHISSGGKRVLLRVTDTPLPATLSEAMRLRDAGNWFGATVVAESLLDSPPETSTRARSLLARIALRNGHAETAARTLAGTARTYSAQREGLDATNDALAAAFLFMVRLHDLESAEQLLGEVARARSWLGEVAVRLPYYRGVWLGLQGQRTAALASYRESSIAARRLGLTDDEIAARQQIATALLEFNQRSAALAEQKALLELPPSKPSACVEVAKWQKLAWFQLSHPERRERLDAARSLEHAQAALARCPDPTSWRTQQLDVVHDALLRHDHARADASLNALSTESRGASNTTLAWETLFRGELALSRGDLKGALPHYRAAAELCHDSALFEQEYLAQLQSGVVLRALGHSEEAERAFLAAEASSERALSSVPFGQGLQLSASSFESSAHELVDLYASEGNVLDAVASAERALMRRRTPVWHADSLSRLTATARSQWYAALAEYQRHKAGFVSQASNDWKLSQDGRAKLRLSREADQGHLQAALNRVYETARANGLIAAVAAPESRLFPVPANHFDSPRLMFFPGVRRYWMLLSTRTGKHLAAIDTSQNGRSDSTSGSSRLRGALENSSVVAAPEPNDVRRVIEGWFDQGHLSSVEVLTVVVHPSIAHWDFHALQVRGAPLAELALLVYSGGSTHRGSSEPNAVARVPRLMVVADPTSDLPLAQREGQQVAARFDGASFVVGSDATRQAVLAQLGHHEMFHYAGHAKAGGVDGLDATIQLADGGLDMADVWTSRAVPRFVVLSACKASLSDNAPAEAAIADGFVSAGSDLVLAPSRVIDDDVAAAFVHAFYSALEGYDVENWARAVQSAWRDVRRQLPNADWAAFRLLSQ